MGTATAPFQQRRDFREIRDGGDCSVALGRVLHLPEVTPLHLDRMDEGDLAGSTGDPLGERAGVAVTGPPRRGRGGRRRRVSWADSVQRAIWSARRTTTSARPPR